MQLGCRVKKEQNEKPPPWAHLSMCINRTQQMKAGLTFCRKIAKGIVMLNLTDSGLVFSGLWEQRECVEPRLRCVCVPWAQPQSLMVCTGESLQWLPPHGPLNTSGHMVCVLGRNLVSWINLTATVTQKYCRTKTASPLFSVRRITRASARFYHHAMSAFI